MLAANIDIISTLNQTTDGIKQMTRIRITEANVDSALANNYGYYDHNTSESRFVGSRDVELQALIFCAANDGDTLALNNLHKMASNGSDKLSMEQYYDVKRDYNETVGRPRDFMCE